jgi:hypothetical protein
MGKARALRGRGAADRLQLRSARCVRGMALLSVACEPRPDPMLPLAPVVPDSVLVPLDPMGAPAPLVPVSLLGLAGAAPGVAGLVLLPVLGVPVPLVPVLLPVLPLPAPRVSVSLLGAALGAGVALL